METISVNGKRYYNLDDIKEYHHDFVYGMTSNASVLKKNKVPDDMHIKAIKNNGAWEQKKNNANENRDLINKAWFLKNYKFDNETKDAPDILQVKKKEMFLDDDDKPVSIEMRGERDVAKCFFLASNIIKYLGGSWAIKNINKSENYTAIEDYIYFYVLNEKTKKRKKSMFLTYSGLMKLFSNSRQAVAKKYMKWAHTTLFDIKHGTLEAKKKVVTSIVGTSPQAISQFFSKVLTLLSCIYLFELGPVKALRSVFDIDEKHLDTDMVYKLGKTKDFKERAAAHSCKYGRYEGVNMKLVLISEIDPKFLSSAEAMIKSYVGSKDFLIETKETSYTELVSIPKNKITDMKKLYIDIANKHKICVDNIEDKLKRSDALIQAKDANIADLKENIIDLKDNVNNLKNAIIDKDEIIKMLKEKLAEKTK